MKKTLIIGFGVSGRSAAKFLLSKGKNVLAVDRNFETLEWESSPFFELKSDKELFSFSDIELVVLSPGVSPQHLLAVEAMKRGVEVIGEIELAMRSIHNPCIGITGTNGKTTTTLLTAHILKTAGIKALALGNTGDSLSEYLISKEKDPNAVLIVELSSFQLETLQKRCLDGAALLNITPDHLDRYSSMEAYAEAKGKIKDCLKPNAPLWISRQIKEQFKIEGLIFDPSIDFRPWEEGKVAPISDVSYMQLGVPEIQNVQAAFALCSGFQISPSDFQKGLRTFRKPAHRIEFVVEKNGISFYNDSKATNIDSVMHAVNLVKGPIVLLVGGVDKGASYSPWIDCFRGKVKMVVAFGQSAHKIEEELGANFPFRRLSTLQEAFSCAVQSAEPNGSVLLSPGCSSYDQFRNYEHRGQEFKRLVEGWV